MKSMSFFSSLTEGVSKLTTEATKAKEKFFEGQTQAEQISFTSLWEMPETVDYCRECAVKVMQLDKHHCRSCAGVFCDDCCPSSVPTTFERTLIPPSLNIGPSEAVRICRGCRRGECPSRVIKEKVRHLLDEEGSTALRSTGRIEKFQQRIGAKLEEAVGQVATTPSSRNRRASALDSPLSVLSSLELKRGSFYGENGMMKKSGSKPVAISGYFEIFNKSREVFAVKVVKRNQVLNSGKPVKFEVPRPSYIAVPPNDAIYAFFDPEKDTSLEILVLHKNINQLPSDQALVVDTKAPGAQPTRLSPCARVDLFEKIQSYTVESQGKNVLLKYKGNGVLMVREGCSMERVGFMGYFQGRRFTEGKLDYQTNVESITVGFSIH